ncbi:MAG: hypothetical protein AAF616_10325 [Bacteroidota bacterium]
MLLVCGVISCNIGELDFENVRVQPISGTFAVPLGFTSYSIQDLLDEQNDSISGLQGDSNSLLSLYYTDSIRYTANDDFVQIQNISSATTLDLSDVPPTTTAGTFTFSKVLSESYNSTGDEELDSVYYTQGELALVVNSNANATINYTITFENTLTVNTREPVVFTGTINSGDGNDIPAPQSLVGYFTRLETDQNLFGLRFDAEVVVGAGEEFTGGETISYEFSYQDQEFDLIYGKFGQDTIVVGTEEIAIDFFEDTGDEGFFLGDPIFRFSYENSFGVPVATDYSGIRSEDENGTSQSLDGFITEPLNLPVIAAPEAPGSSAQTIMEISRSNSNINQLLSNSPSKLIFNVTAYSNYYQNPAANFVQPGNEIDGFIEVEIPLEVSLKDYVQTFAFNLNGGLNTQDVDSAYLRVVTLNELPFSGRLAMQIQDTLDAPIYDIPEVLVFAAPFINQSGFVVDPSGASADIPLPPEAIEALAIGDRIEMIVTLNTPVSQTSRDIFVKILADYTLDIKLGLGGRYNYEF